jgi:hypothetical protein
VERGDGEYGGVVGVKEGRHVVDCLQSWNWDERDLGFEDVYVGGLVLHREVEATSAAELERANAFHDDVRVFIALPG